MNLIDQIEQTIADEGGAYSDYDDIIEEVKQDKELNENDKSLIVGILFKISTDEKTHKVLLRIIKEVLDSYQ